MKMQILNNSKKILLSLFILCLSTVSALALEVEDREELNLDDTLAEQQVLYSQPSKIYISQVVSMNKELKNDSKAWIRALYYYSITRLKLNDIPYNYLIDTSGNVYEVSKGGIGANPGLQEGDNTVLIGILDNDTSLTPRAESSLIELVENLSYKYGITKGSWDLVNLKIAKSETQRSYLVAKQSNSSLKESIAQSLEQVNWSDVEHLDYIASIESVEYAKEVEIGKELTVKVKIKNENDFTWFVDKNYAYISTEDGKDSPFAINTVWQSFSKPGYIEGRFVAPGDVVEVEFLMGAKSRPGEYSEKFVFTKEPNMVFEGSSFEVLFNIVAGQNKLVEVVSPEYGFVNIRECRWYSCEKIEVANDGDVFIMVKEEEGWYEIRINDSSTGWVYQKYMREL